MSATDAEIARAVTDALAGFPAAKINHEFVGIVCVEVGRTRPTPEELDRMKVAVIRGCEYQPSVADFVKHLPDRDAKPLSGIERQRLADEQLFQRAGLTQDDRRALWDLGFGNIAIKDFAEDRLKNPTLSIEQCRGAKNLRSEGMQKKLEDLKAEFAAADEEDRRKQQTLGKALKPVQGERGAAILQSQLYAGRQKGTRR